MTTASLKLAYALITIGVAICVYIIGEPSGDPTWIAGAYFIATIVFAALIARLTLIDLSRRTNRDENHFDNELLFWWMAMPPIYFVWGLVDRDFNFALLAFSLSSGVIAVSYVLFRAFQLICPLRPGVQ